MTLRSTVVLTERQRGILQIALEIARDKFRDNARLLEKEFGSQGMADTFDEQAEDADALLNMVTLADEITITEEVER